jgi:outer membrane protein OmpA-like peptidoglycan-associated protein
MNKNDGGLLAMKKFHITLTIFAAIISAVFVFSSCATQQEAVVEEEPQVVKEPEPEPERKEVAKAEPEVEEEVVVEEEVIFEEEPEEEEEAPDLMIVTKVEEEIESAVEEEIESAPTDSDGDGVVDSMDRCPGTPRGVAVDQNGCPEVIVEIASIEFTLEFAIDSAMIRPEYEQRGKEAIVYMNAHPEARLVDVLVEGHTDSTGTDAYNYKLSMRRAYNVEQYLVKELGIDPDIIQTAAFGEKYPVASNNNAADRQRNRRVDITFTLRNLNY